MNSRLGWIRFDPKEYDLAAEARALLTTPGSVDALGLGGIRDRFADAMFPGTSTIQTRLRYALFVAWTYDSLRNLPSADLVREARAEEIATIKRLQQGEAGNGIIGVRAGETLVRLPSMSYWTLLQNWRNQQSGEDSLPSRSAWLAMTPKERESKPLLLGRSPRRDFKKSMTFALESNEIEYLRWCWKEREAGLGKSLFHELLIGTAEARGENPAFSDIEGGSATNRTILERARAFSSLTAGASIAYNMLLLRKRLRGSNPSFVAGSDPEPLSPDSDEQLLRDRQKDWNDWKKSDRAQFAAMISDSDFFHLPNCTTEEQAVEFTKAWASRAASIEDPDDVKSIIATREERLKGKAQQRFSSVRALARWGGASDIHPASFRWETAYRFLLDLRASGVEQPRQVAVQ